MLSRLWRKSHLEFFKIIGVSLGITVIFLVYLWLIGIPRTTARSLFNEGKYQEAYQAWPEGYIQERLN